MGSMVGPMTISELRVVVERVACVKRRSLRRRKWVTFDRMTRKFDPLGYDAPASKSAKFWLLAKTEGCEWYLPDYIKIKLYRFPLGAECSCEVGDDRGVWLHIMWDEGRYRFRLTQKRLCDPA